MVAGERYSPAVASVDTACVSCYALKRINVFLMKMVAGERFELPTSGL